MAEIPAHCALCPRGCGADRRKAVGFCGGGHAVKVARVALHFWEEPCISGKSGSGAVFFSGCPLGCIFCQNHAISHENFGCEVSTAQLAELFLRLQGQGAHNLNLVTGTHYAPWIAQAVDRAKQKGFRLPVVWNTSGYETEEAVNFLAGFVDVWLADLKFYAPALSAQVAGAPDYFAVASRAVQKMAALAGAPRVDGKGLLQSGLVVRLLVLPGQREDAKALLRWMAENLPKGGFLLSLLRQYTPPRGLALPPLHRKLASYEYNDVLDTAVMLELTSGFAQRKESAQQAYIPPFDLTGL